MNSIPITFRSATIDDASAVTQIYNHYVADSTCTWDTAPAKPERFAAMIQAATEAFPFLVAHREKDIVAWGALRQFKERDGYLHTATDIVYVGVNDLGQGLGRKMLAELIEWARVVGHHSIIAQVSADQGASIGLHEALGFEQVGCIREAGIKFGDWIDLIDMQLML